MISYDYAMFAAGFNSRFETPYSTLAKQFILDKNNHNKNRVHITTNDDINKLDNTFQYKIDEKYPIFAADCEGLPDCPFNYNIKFLSLKNAFENSNAEYLIYVDSDFQFHSNYKEDAMQQILSECKNNNYDFVSSKSYKGDVKSFSVKYQTFSLEDDHEIYSFREGFLIFKNTYKVKFFLEKWEQLYWHLIEKNVTHWAEALEIGISAKYADMKAPKTTEEILDVFKNAEKMFWELNSSKRKVFRF